MPIIASTVTVGTAATLLASGADATIGDSRIILLRNESAVTIFLGGPGVTTTDGWPMLTATSVSMELGPGDVLYGCVAAATQPIKVLKQRQ